MTRLPVVDFHSHVLPRMDDGCESLAMSLEVLKRARNAGIDLMVGTSHYYHRRESVKSFLERREASLERLRGAMDGDCSGVIPGAEVAFYFGIEEDPDLERLCIGDTRAILLEMPFDSWGVYEKNALSSLCFDRRLKVILAHYERFESFQRKNDLYREILRLPVVVQINAESIMRGFGAKKWISMFRDGSAHLLGSDCHNLSTRPPNLAEGRKVLSQRLGDDVLAAMDRFGADLLLDRDLP